jgi:hypothetical protein
MKSNLERLIPILVKFLPIFIRLMPIFIKLFPIFERFVPVLVSYFIERVLRTLKAEGKVNDYRTRTARTTKFHYKIDIRLVLTAEQAKILLNDLVTRLLEIFGWNDGS